MPITATKKHLHIARDESGGVAVAVDHTDPVDAAVELACTGDDAAAVVSLSADEAVRVAFDLLKASGRDPLNVMGALVTAYERHGARPSWALSAG